MLNELLPKIDEKIGRHLSQLQQQQQQNKKASPPSVVNRQIDQRIGQLRLAKSQIQMLLASSNTNAAIRPSLVQHMRKIDALSEKLGGLRSQENQVLYTANRAMTHFHEELLHTFNQVLAICKAPQQLALKASASSSSSSSVSSPVFATSPFSGTPNSVKSPGFSGQPSMAPSREEEGKELEKAYQKWTIDSKVPTILF